MWSKDFWVSLTERALSTGAQAAIAAITAAGTGLIDTDWTGIGSIVGMAIVLSVLKSLGANAVTGTGPSLTKSAEVVPTEVVADYTDDEDDDGEVPDLPADDELPPNPYVADDHQGK